VHSDSAVLDGVVLCFCMRGAVHPLCVVSEEKQASDGRSILTEGELDVGEGCRGCWSSVFLGCIGMCRLQRGIMGV